MQRHSSQEGAALIMLMGIMATLAIVCAMLVMVVLNQQRATANVRSSTQSLYAGEGALDSAVQMTKVASPMPTASPATPWLTDAALAAAFNSQFPPGATVSYLYYDNIPSVDTSRTWDSNVDKRMWVEATCLYQKKTTRTRVLIQQLTLPFAAALPKAVTYSDTGIRLEEYSDIYAINADGTPDSSGAPYVTAISAGGTWTPSMSSTRAEVGRFTLNSTSDLAAPGSSVQSLGIRANGSAGAPSVYPTSAPTHTLSAGGRTYNDVTIAPETIGFLSDYFDQAAQASLIAEAQKAGPPGALPAPPAPPTAPTPWTYDTATWTRINSAPPAPSLATIQGASYTATADLYQTTATSSGNMTLSSSSARTYSFRKLYVAGNLTINGPITFSARSLFVGGTLTITGPTTSTVAVTINNDADPTDPNRGVLYVNGTGTSYVRNRVTLSATAVYCGGSLEFRNTTTTTMTNTIPRIYVGADFSVPVGGSSPNNYTARVQFNASSSLYAGDDITLNTPSSGTVTNTIPLIYAYDDFLAGVVALNVSSCLHAGGNLTLNGPSSGGITYTIPQIYAGETFSQTGVVTLNVSSSLYAGGDLTLSGPASGTITDTFGLICAGGTKPVDYSGGERNTLLFSGNVIVNTRAVSAFCHQFTITGATTPLKDWLGAVRVYARSNTSDASQDRGTILWEGTASVTSRDYTLQADPASEAAQPQPMWLGRYFERRGTYADEYGNIWVPGNSGTSVVFGSTGSSSVLCVLLCTTEKTAVSGNIKFGSRAQPMVFFYVCDNNGIYPQVVQWAGTGTYYGLMIINESTITFSGQSNSSIPSVEGAVFAGCPYDPTITTTMSQSDIVLQDSCSIAYNQAVVGGISTSSLKTTTTVTQTVPGSWQQLSVN